jgi:anaerobic selenocysteine-containing dehydrogenase
MMQGITYESLLEKGYQHLNHPEDWRPFAEGGFPTRSGKAELYSESLLDAGQDALPSPGEIRRGRRNQLQLISGKTLHYLNTGYSHMDRHSRREGILQIRINSADADERGLRCGQRVRVFNELGEVEAVCEVSDVVQPGVAWAPFGGIADAADVQRHVNCLTPEEPTDWGGGSGFYDTFIDVESIPEDHGDRAVFGALEDPAG